MQEQHEFWKHLCEVAKRKCRDTPKLNNGDNANDQNANDKN